jgi:GAF domain-containing protein
MAEQQQDHDITALLNRLTQSVEDLATVFGQDDEVTLALQRLAEVTASCVTRSAMASLTVHTDLNDHRTAAATHDQAREADFCQYKAHQGPTLSCMDSGKVIRADHLQAEQQWPEFTALVANSGIGSFLSAPLVVGRWFQGALTLYGPYPDGFSEVDAAMFELLATTAEVALLNAFRYQEAAERVAALENPAD